MIARLNEMIATPINFDMTLLLLTIQTYFSPGDEHEVGEWQTYLNLKEFYAAMKKMLLRPPTK